MSDEENNEDVKHNIRTLSYIIKNEDHIKILDEMTLWSKKTRNSGMYSYSVYKTNKNNIYKNIYEYTKKHEMYKKLQKYIKSDKLKEDIKNKKKKSKQVSSDYLKYKSFIDELHNKLYSVYNDYYK